MSQAARVVVEVLAGLIPGTAEPELTRRFVLSANTWAELGDTERVDGARLEALAEIAGKAQGYATLLMLQPDRLNWVRVDWLWL